MTIEYVPQTAVETMARIATGVDPWIAFRDFLEDWTYLPASRSELVAGRPPFDGEDERRWATLMAAAVAALCGRDGLIAPGWTGEPVFRLDEPWYLYEGMGRISQGLAPRDHAPRVLLPQHLEWRPARVAGVTAH